MKRKLTAMILVFAMLASLFPAVAADTMSATPTVEEILSEYHRKAFEAQIQGDTETASTWSRRSGNAKTLEQETVDTLTEAGYEAYNVTAYNYETLGEELQTDFVDMGLDPEGSYIIVIDGEDPTESTSSGGASTYNVSPNPKIIGPPDGGSPYDYVYNGITYSVRFVSVVSTSEVTNLNKNTIFSREDSFWLDKLVKGLAETALITGIDKGVTHVTGCPVPVATFASLLIDAVDNTVYTELESGMLPIHATTTWTLNAVQVWSDFYGVWKTTQYSASATSRAKCAGYLEDPATSESTWHEGPEFSNTRYSAKYNNMSDRKLDAVLAFRANTKVYDRTGDIGFYLGDPDGETIYFVDGGALFTHTETWKAKS